MKVSLKNVKKAKQKLDKYLKPSPLIRNEWLSNKYRCDIYLKLESLLPVGSFKMRGAFNCIAQLSEEDRLKGVIAASAGNHAQGVAWAASKFSIPATIVMPENSPLVKIMNTQALGAKVILHGTSVDESFEHVQEILKKEDLSYVHPFHDENVIAGQATIGLELLEQLPDMNCFIGSIGGGGLMGGIGSVIKECFHHVDTIGVQATGASSMVKSLQQGKLIPSTQPATFADGIKVKNPNQDMFNLLNEVLTDYIHIDDDKTAQALLVLMEQARIIAEGAGAITLAAFNELYEKKPSRFLGKKVVLLVCGGNIDINLLDRIIDKGLIESYRRVKFKIFIDDKPGSLTELTARISETHANILQVIHDRNAPYLELTQSLVEVIVETRNEEHAIEVTQELEKYYRVLKGD